MKVFNLTDVPTPMLQRRGLVKTAFKVGSTVITPGSSASVKDTAAHRQELAPFVAAGAAAVGRPPKGYEPAGKKEEKKLPDPNPAPVPEPSAAVVTKPEDSSEESTEEEEEKSEEGGRRRGRRRGR